LGCFSWMKPSAPRGREAVWASASRPSGGIIATARATVSNSSSMTVPVRVSSARTTSLPVPLFLQTSLALPLTKTTPAS